MLTLRNIHKSFDTTPALKGVSFEIAPREIVALLGPSGCGKSTLMNVIAGLAVPDAGQVLWNGRDLAGLPPHKRGFGLMFQDYALFPHMNATENIAFGLKMSRQPSPEIDARLQELLALVGLTGYARRDVNTLSGGEQQRVALARSLAPRPRLLMLDEPLGALDRALRERLLDELRAILRQMRQTALYVTHDQQEAFALADRVVVMNTGQAVQVGTPQEIYRQPADLFVARFLGFDNLLEGRVMRVRGQRVVDTVVGAFALPSLRVSSGRVTLLLRPDAVQVVDREQPCQLTGTLVECSFRGHMSRAVVEVNGIRLTFNFPAQQPLPAEGGQVRLAFELAHALQVF